MTNLTGDKKFFGIYFRAKDGMGNKSTYAVFPKIKRNPEDGLVMEFTPSAWKGWGSGGRAASPKNFRNSSFTNRPNERRNEELPPALGTIELTEKELEEIEEIWNRDNPEGMLDYIEGNIINVSKAVNRWVDVRTIVSADQKILDI